MRASRDPEPRKRAQRWLSGAPDRKKNERVKLGSAVHALIEAHILGQPVPEELLNNEEFAPYIEHFHAFVDDWQITFTASEMVVANDEAGYAGARVARLLTHDVGVVLHLRPEGYRLYPVRCGDAEFEVFTHVQRVAEFQTGASKAVVGTALTPPHLPRKAAAA
ncbi:hypothetical protein EBO15_16675 [Actinomadura harenae]|uniref:PD-(D/E)XK endonuclease-like domain-containing protein n=1 Tax=Actinomadura harenae TaxID=2483351 RepID=A0A3M2M0L4_9ACTN|nr:hypothetical protein EBO15_16675 [Actinomadura harenae]